ncbi:hypothetical protein [Bradyrhizobium sp. cf659]|uniref:hypothetical protein n=1 Tax=Bradyrhizobium sp. cf659 TaxID=1761771 RepID=UPI0008F1A03C|nr:hypothetical protein [Bradyrhizobium sp. cf659]SFH69956.1 hypothetical protein SAMN04487925_10163 [Bradyrhizobium sp. cf659]
MSTAPARHIAVAEDRALPHRTDHHVARFRPRELLRLMSIRYGREIHADEAGLRLRDRMLDALALSGSAGRRRAENFLTLYCRWMTACERDSAIEAAFRDQRLWSAEALGNDLDVTEAEHARARIRTFRIAGMTDADMKIKRAAKEAARKKQERLQQRLGRKPKEPRPAARVDAILNIMPEDHRWWSVGAVISELKRSKAIAFATLDKQTSSLRPAVHRAIKHGVAEGRLDTRMVPGSKMSEAMEIRRGGRQ